MDGGGASSSTGGSFRLGATIGQPDAGGPQVGGDTDREMMGRALQGLALVTLGEVAEGMRRLDEVNAAIVAGEPITAATARRRSTCSCARAPPWTS